jgi:Putative restriction endonuclease
LGSSRSDRLTERRLDAPDVLVAIEVASPGSRRTDAVTKRSECAEATIEHYWIAEFGPPTGTFTTSAPVPLRLDLDALGEQ